MPGDGERTGAGARCGCGRAVEAGHRYCPRCGSLVGHLTEEDSSAGVAVELLSPASGQVADSATADGVVRTGPTAPGRLAAIGAVAVLGLLAWGLFRQPSGEIAPERPSGDEAAVGEDGGETADRATTTTRRARTTRSTSTTISTTVVLSGADGAAGLLLGEETGLSLAVGTERSTGVRILDLDTGELRDLGVRGGPLGQLGSSLLIAGNDGRPRLVSLDAAAADEVRLAGRGGWGEVVNIADDRVWLLEDRGEGPMLVAYDESGEIVDRTEPVGSVMDLSSLVAGVRPPEVISSSAGGLYRQEGDRYRLVARGEALAVGRRLALMLDCDEALDCTRRWYGIETSQPVDLPPPEAGDDVYFQIIGDDRWLVRLDWRAGGGQLIEITSGQVVRQLAPETLLGPGSPAAAISEDGRWLVDRSGGRTFIVDLDDGTEWPIDGAVGWVVGWPALLVDTVG